MDEDTVTVGGPRYFACVWRERMTDGRMGWVCATPDNAYERGRGPYGYGKSRGEAMLMFARSRFAFDGTPVDALTRFDFNPQRPERAGAPDAE